MELNDFTKKGVQFAFTSHGVGVAPNEMSHLEWHKPKIQMLWFQFIKKA